MHQPDLACDSSLTLSCHRSSWQTPRFWPGFSSNVCFQPCKFLLPEQSTPSFSCLCAKVLPPGCSYPVSVTIRRHFLLACPCPVGSPLPPWLFPSSRSMKLTVLNPFSSKGGRLHPSLHFPKASWLQVLAAPRVEECSPGAGYSKNFGCVSQSRKRRGAAGRRRGKVLQNPAWQARIQRKSGERKGLEVRAARKSPGP